MEVEFDQIDGSFSGEEELHAAAHALGPGEAVIAMPLRLEIPSNPSWQLMEPQFSVDRRAYELRKGEFAVGIRFTFTTEFPAGENTTETLYLYRLNDGKIVRVLRLDVANDDRQRGPNDRVVARTALEVLPTESQGLRDLRVRSTFQRGHLVEDGSVTTERRTSRLIWNGTSYDQAK